MSVINQVLNQLEQRGEHTAPEQTMVRAVPHSKRNPAMYRVLLPVLLLAVAVAMWQWLKVQNSEPVTENVSAKANISEDLPGLDKSEVVQQQAASAVMLSSVEQPVEKFPPSLRLSFELSSVPMPLVQREESNELVPGIGDVPVKETSASTQYVKPQPVPPSTRQAFSGALPMKRISPAQQADTEFRKAAAMMQQGRIDDAQAGYEEALRLDAGYDAARQALVALLLESKRGEEAERVLQQGLKNKPQHTGFAMLMARLQVERGAVEQATATLAKTLPYADTQADYHAFFAALLQREKRHKEAINHYQIALQLVPNNGLWLMGYGISLQAVQRNEDARTAYSRALESKMLSPELQAFVQQKLKAL